MESAISSHDEVRKASLTDCYFFLNGMCSKGDACSYRHCTATLKVNTPCKYWLAGTCTNPTCMFRHPSIGLKPHPVVAPADRSQIACYWLTQPGGCKKGDACPYSHDPALQQAAKQTLDKQLNTAETATTTATTSTNNTPHQPSPSHSKLPIRDQQTDSKSASAKHDTEGASKPSFVKPFDQIMKEKDTKKLDTSKPPQTTPTPAAVSSNKKSRAKPTDKTTTQPSPNDKPKPKLTTTSATTPNARPRNSKDHTTSASIPTGGAAKVSFVKTLAEIQAEKAATATPAVTATSAATATPVVTATPAAAATRATRPQTKRAAEEIRTDEMDEPAAKRQKVETPSSAVAVPAKTQSTAAEEVDDIDIDMADIDIDLEGIDEEEINNIIAEDLEALEA